MGWFGGCRSGKDGLQLLPREDVDYLLPVEPELRIGAHDQSRPLEFEVADLRLIDH
jgi:hypothetical protein